MAAKNRAARSRHKAEVMRSRRIPCPYIKGDIVSVHTGKELKAVGEFLAYDAKKNRVFLLGRMLVKHFVKADPNNNKAGGEVHTELSIHVSNTALNCPHCSKPTRLVRRETWSAGDERNAAGMRWDWQCRECGESVPRNPKKD
ncbi:MAG: hypothetical protein LBT40_10550 [Deltaproteobacteria bacterium]|jgi:ribosomal protein L24|nr:hypothetical protein [Deltaproteobacteria bacterium]